MEPVSDIRVGDLVVSPGERRAYFRDAELTLTPREFGVLSALASRPGWVFSADQLAEVDALTDCASPPAVNVHVSHLRAKLTAAGANDPIVTVRGVGWRMRRPPSEQAIGVEPGALFVGRADEMRALSDALSPGRGSLAVVTGEAGIGKTSLIEHVLEATAPRFEVIRAVCDGNGSGDYWLWRQLLGELERRSGAALVEQPDGHLLARLIGTAPGSADPPPAGADRTRAYEAVKLYLADVLPVRSRPMVFFIDDLHWADGASLKLLSYILRRLATLPCCMIAATRSTDAGVRTELRGIRDYAAQRRNATLIELSGLGRTEIAQFIEFTVGRDGDVEFVAALDEKTAGNPLYLWACMRSLRDGRDLGGAPEVTAAQAVASLVHDEVAWLPEATRQVVSYAAVVGVEFSACFVANVADQGEAAFDAALGARMLVPAQRGRLRFRHALVREALLGAMSRVEREEAHLRIAKAIEAEAGGATRSANRLAHHYSLAGANSRARAVGFYLAAGRESATRFAFEDSITSLDAALSIIDSAGFELKRARRVRSWVLERMASARAALGENTAAIACYEEALSVRPHDDHHARARLYTKLGSTCMNLRLRGDVEQSFNSALACLEVLDVRDDAWWRALIEIRLGQAEASSMTDASLPFDLRADLEETVMSRGSAPQQSKYYCQLAVQLASEERWLPTEEVIDTARRALDTAEHDGGDYLRAYATGLLGSLLAMKGSHAEAETVLRQARGLSRRCTDTLGEAASILFLGISARLSGDVRMTEVHAVELRTMAADRIQMPEFVSGAEAQLAWVALRRGRLDEAAALAEGALEIWQRDPACSQSVWMMAWPALSCALAEGDLCRAAEFAVLMTRPDQQALADDIDRRLADAAAIVRRGDKKKGAKLFAQLEAEAGEYGYA